MIKSGVSGVSRVFSIKTSYKEEYILRIYRNSFVAKPLTGLTWVEKLAQSFYRTLVLKKLKPLARLSGHRKRLQE